MSEFFETPDLTLALPEIWLLLMACVVLVVDLFSRDRNHGPAFLLSQASLLIAIALIWTTQAGIDASTFNAAYVVDAVARLLKTGILLITFLGFAYSRAYMRDRGLLRGEYYVLGLFCALGMLVTVSAGSLLTLYLGIELMSLCLYALVAFDRDSRVASEAAMKYFVLGALASGMLLYGMSMVYGVSGSLELATITEVAGSLENNRLLFIFGLVFLLVGVAFKFGAVPFHMWVPDVYEGAPTPVTLIIATASKLTALGLFLRLIGEGLLPFAEQWQAMILILAVLSLVLGNTVAIAQTNIKRMLAYSTFNHVAFMLMGLSAGTAAGFGAATFYALTYSVTVAATFGVILLLAGKGFESDRIEDFKGLVERSPLFAFIMLLLMVSLTGIPGTVGFYAKWMVLDAVIQSGQIWLAVLAVIAAVVGAFYYLRIVRYCFFDKPVSDTVPALQPSTGFRALLAVNGLAVLVFGLFPGTLIAWCMAAFG